MISRLQCSYGTVWPLPRLHIQTLNEDLLHEYTLDSTGMVLGAEQAVESVAGSFMKIRQYHLESHCKLRCALEMDTCSKGDFAGTKSFRVRDGKG